ncbi:hypothetical protein AHiyo1_50780 [Arthrobacter sp. Hiyo1]|nr:hypothetical protein AHiyo1_50780 [Arthrobacter sp. Hiyo1]
MEAIGSLTTLDQNRSVVFMTGQSIRFWNDTMTRADAM